MPSRPSRLARAFAVATLLLPALACEPSTGPVVPILPPLTISAPNGEGEVSVMGDAEPDALVFALNEARGAGVIGTADEDGRFLLTLAASVGDEISVWQQVGVEQSPPRLARVPPP